MRVLIIEDETAASENLIAMLQEIDNEIEVLQVLESVQQTIRWLSSHPAPDLIFMDIHLSDGSAFTLFQEMEVTVPIVFTTAYDQYALDAFTVNSVDYLLKPIKTSELTRALDKFKRWTQSVHLQHRPQDANLPEVGTDDALQPLARLHCRRSRSLEVLPCQQTVHRGARLCEGDRRVVRQPSARQHAHRTARTALRQQEQGSRIQELDDQPLEARG